MERRTLSREVQIQSNAVSITGDLTVPEGSSTIILFAHGSGSSRHSTRNKYVASQLNRSGFATLLMDLLTLKEEREEHFTQHFRFDIDLLAQRLCSAVDWLAINSSTKNLAVGLFGASTGSAAALACAAEKNDRIAAVVSRGGRPDLVPNALPNVLCPTLFIVGGFDPQVLFLNEKALHQMHCQREIEIVPGAGHLFEEAGKMDIVASMATWWFARHCPLQFAPEMKSYELAEGMSPSIGDRRKSLENSGQQQWVS
ncbi:MAG TPA: alpha/beta hydrolase [Candidatus Melainabacteria bacterium]|nr:alpha/beta hydrolase [Candidatus Melainabacteria bacterium]HIN65178.1 alpha/beta hydrolase [Candidatus Obscuribacterales bacterium]